MSAQGESSPSIQSMLEMFLGSQLASIISEVREATWYDLPEARTKSFLRFHSFIVNHKPTYIDEWRSDPKTEQKWYVNHMRIIDDVRSACAAAHYHAENLRRLEHSVIEVLAKSDVYGSLGNGTIGLGSTRKLDFEYHAFVLACRRSLDYLAAALCCYFKREGGSFRTLPRNIQKSKTPSVASAISEAHNRHLAKLDFILGEGKTSVRNRIAHYDFVPSGCINLNRDGFFLLGGGERLNYLGSRTYIKLCDNLDSRMNDLHECVDDMIDSFIAAAKEQNYQ